MAFDQNSIHKDLRPLNIYRTMPEETRIAPVTTSGKNIEGFYANPPRNVCSPGSIPMYYPATISDTGFVGLAYGNAAPGIAGWCSRMPTAVVSPTGVNSTTGYSYNPNCGTRVGSSASDQASDEGGDDSVSGKKVKFLCSFGGKILPRPSDGVLRYVGGQTRIISVRRDISFDELFQKMVDIYGQNVAIKYQLPEEDLDALVSVSCLDDLENMMDEYEKLIERSSDGSVKLRVFLLSASELDSSGMAQFGDLQDCGQRYVEAVNGIMEGAGGGIMRKESIASAASTQNSDLSGTEPIDSSGHGQGDVTGPPSTGILSPKGNSATSEETAPRLVSLDPNPAFYAEVSTASLGTPVVNSGPPQTLSAQPEHELERSVPATLQQQQVGFDLQQPGVNFAPPAPYLQAYVDPHQEAMKHADFVQLPSQMGFPTQLLGTVGPMYAQQPFRDNTAGISAHQFIPAMHMTMAPSSHVNVKPNVVPQLVQPQQIRLDSYPEENNFGSCVVQVPGDQSYIAYQAQVPPAVVGGGYGWYQVPPPEQVVSSGGWVPYQQVILPEKSPRFEDCYMCQKALPHAHSDTLVLDQRESPASTISDSNSAYHSPRVEDNLIAWPINRAVAVGALGESSVEQQGAGARQRVFGRVYHEAGTPQSEAVGFSQNVEGQYENQRIILQKIDNSDQTKVSVPQAVAGGVQSPYGVFMNTTPQSYQENSVQQLVVPAQYQVKQEPLNKPANSDFTPVGGMRFQTSDPMVHESPKDYPGKLPGGVPKEDTIGSCITYEHLRPIDGRMENLRICPSEVFVNNEQSKSPVDNPKKEDNLENIPQQIDGREAYLDNTFSKPNVVLDTNQIKSNEMLPCSSNEVSYLHNFRPLDSYEVAQPPILGNAGSHPHSKIGINHLTPDEVSYGNPALSGVDLAHVTERIPPSGELRDNSSRIQPKMVPSDVEANSPSSLSPSNRVGDIQDTSNSLFSNQDPWNLQHDTHFHPPRPNKIPTKKEVFAAMDPFGENQLGNSGESSTGNSGELTTEVHLEDGVYQPSDNSNMDFGLEHVRPIKGSAEELIKQELQAVAEGVAASVLLPSVPSNPDLSVHERSESFSEANQDIEVLKNDVEVQHRVNFEEVKTKMPEKINLGFPVSDGIGRLQIIKNSDLEELHELGSGTFGTVYHGKWRGSDVAIKRINDRCFAGKPSEQERMRDDFWNEAIKLADLHHPNVVAFYGVVLDGPGGSVATVTEYMVNGSLRNALQKNERSLDKRKRLLIAMDVAFGMEYLHGKNIVHFDLKSDNLLVNLRDPHRPICKVGDLGLSKVKCQTLISGGVRGTLPWMAPELLNGSSSLVSEKVDVFSFGIVMWELLTGEEPYADLHYGAIIGGIVSNTLRPPVPESCDPEWRSLMERCWSSEPAERPSFTEIANQLRSMAAKIPLKGQTQQPLPSTQLQVRK
uniref:Protein kinase domain-containing protein n=1 Tax=Davidia involucrata TaxID=16924 RepID=A0A5B6Z740_DAVIN